MRVPNTCLVVFELAIPFRPILFNPAPLLAGSCRLRYPAVSIGAIAYTH